MTILERIRPERRPIQFGRIAKDLMKRDQVKDIREAASDANAVRCARSPSPYVSTAASCVFDQVSCAFFGDRRSVPGISSRAGISGSPPRAGGRRRSR